MASTEPARAFQADPYDYGEVRRLASELSLAEPVAITLVRRGYRTVDAARRFLEAREEHDPLEFDGMGEVCERILSVVHRRGRITVHGDYDVDGVSSTAILVSTLRSLGAECDWLIPDRLADGYGLTMRTVEKLRQRGTELVVTVDCGIGSVEEVAAARAAGMEVVVTDHHLPGDELPDCPIVHPVVSEYPFEGLCAAGVAHKLAVALCDAAGQGAVETVGGRRDARARVSATRDVRVRDLDLVALATVADMVPLVGENRRLVREGLRVLRDSPQVGLRALMAAAGVDPEAVDSGALGFRLAPRINAAGRLYRADAGVELMLTQDRDRAAQIAEELDRANAERRWAERKAVEGAERARSTLPPELAEAPALVLAGEGWHPGVVGIAASRLAERHYRPTILLSVDGSTAKGSARSIPGFDLVAALGACDSHLTRYGGHRAAAGLELETKNLDAFREAFIDRAAAEIDPSDLVRREQLDALVGVGRDGIGMDLARQLETLGPFGMGNPGPRLLVPSGRLREVRPLGEEGKHSRFQLESGAGRALGVAFGMNGEISKREDEALDLSIELEVDRWNGAEQPRVVVRELYPLAGPTAADPRSVPCGEHCPAPDAEWWERLERELGRIAEGRPGALLDVRAPESGRRETIDRRGGAAVASLAELISSGEPLLAICADAARRARLASEAADPRRFGAAVPRIVCCRCGSTGLDAALAHPPPTGLVLTDWTALALRPGTAAAFRHVVLIDPPPSEALESLARATREPAAIGGRSASYLHLAWGPAEADLAERLLGWEWNLRAAIRDIWRGLAADGGEADGPELRSLLAGDSVYPRTPELAARCIGVLAELGLCEWLPDRGGFALWVLSSERTDLGRSRAYADCIARHQEAIRFLRSKAQPA
ncbi:MAG TPA: single-stranded-DNA-specific exonuclease RecJ [Solirubrobacterales bacterium]|nr:single-stranded-DNA-specific exonuclease RecJ [Solirubrobacterales bacterium]